MTKVQFLPDGMMHVLRDDGGSVLIWRTRQLQQRTYELPKQKASAVSFKREVVKHISH